MMISESKDRNMNSKMFDLSYDKGQTEEPRKTQPMNVYKCAYQHEQKKQVIVYLNLPHKYLM